MNYFKFKEFDSPDLPNSGRNMDANFLELLDFARTIAGIPFKITSGYRTKAHNEALKAKGYSASPNSSHCKGLAVDISIPDSSTRHKILTSLIEAGFTRIGISDNFIHVDADKDKAQGVIWTY
tara:strand:+ start:171 stop:539 length:369 start_codon:yes stop_codon:yes gene_type:complete